MSNLRVKVIWCFFLFFFVFGLWQIMYVLADAHLLPEWLQPTMYLEIQIVSLGATALLIINGGSSFQDYGFRRPNSRKFLSVSLLLALIHLFITLFLPGSFVLFEALPPVTSSQFLLGITSALFLSLASESVFRGYIQTNLTKAYGFPLAVYISSLMFSLYSLPLLMLPRLNPPTYIFTNAMPLFITGIFLGYFFKRTGNLSYPVAFYTFVLLLRYLTSLALANAYVALLFEIIAYSFLILIVRFWGIFENNVLERKS